MKLCNGIQQKPNYVFSLMYTLIAIHYSDYTSMVSSVFLNFLYLDKIFLCHMVAAVVSIYFIINQELLHFRL